MKFDSIDFNLILLSSMWLIAGIIATWFYMKKTILAQSLENQNAQKSLRDLLEKNEALLIEKMELDTDKLTKDLQESLKSLPTLTNSSTGSIAIFS